MNIAIVTIAYNRTASLKRLLDSLLRADYNGCRVTLIMSIDKSKTSEVEDFADGFDWPFGEKIVKKHTENMGLRRHILSQGEELDKYDAIIVLEDDVVVSKAFYRYALQTVEKYADSDWVAGISLYSFPVNNYTYDVFEAANNGYGVFAMKVAQSWGQIWMRRQWKEFYEWYLKNTDFAPDVNIPPVLFTWDRSWLKYHNRFCIETGKYFIYPYIAFSSNCGEQGEHAVVTYNNYQTVMQNGWVTPLALPDSADQAVCYDGFFENEALYKALGLKPGELCLDINGIYRQYPPKRYILTTRHLDYKVVREFGLQLHPIEYNVIDNVPGHMIFLYDTTIAEPNTAPRLEHSLIPYHYRLPSMLNTVRFYGLANLGRDFINRALQKLKK